MAKERVRDIVNRIVSRDYSILNRDNVIKNNTDELIELVIDIVKNIPTGNGSRKKKKDKEEDTKKKKKTKKKKEEEKPKWVFSIDYINHTTRIPTQKDKSDNALIQYIKFRNIPFDYPFYVRMDDSHLIELNIMVMFSPFSYKQNFQDVLKYNTKNQLLNMIEQGVPVNITPNVQAILDYDGDPYIDPDNADHKYSLLQELKLYIPINTNGFYHINGRKIYNGYYLHDPNQMADGGKKIVIHHSSSVSFMYMGTGDMLHHQVFGDNINPFIYEEEDDWNQIAPIFEPSVTDEQLDIIKKTHTKYLEEKKNGTLKIPLDKAMAEIHYEDVYAAIITLFDIKNNPSSYKDNGSIYFRKYASLRGSQEPNVEHAIRDCIPSFKNNEPRTVAKGWNVHPESLITAIIMKNQFIANAEPNPLDIFHVLSFTRVDSKNITESSRYVSEDEMGIVDPIYTTGQDIGASGVICPSAKLDIRK